jgi:hypothetical protein
MPTECVGQGIKIDQSKNTRVYRRRVGHWDWWGVADVSAFSVPHFYKHLPCDLLTLFFQYEKRLFIIVKIL